MPRAPKKCAHPLCEERVVGTSFCSQHNVRWDRGSKSRTSTSEHRAWRKYVLDRDHWWCKIKGPGCKGRAKTADHIVPVAQGGAEYDVANGQAACSVCHLEKSLREATFGRRGGPPPAPGG